MSIKSSKLQSCQYQFFEDNGFSCGSIDNSMDLSWDATIVIGLS